MGVMSVSVPRVSNSLRSMVILSNVNQTAAELLAIQNQMSSGRRIQSPSDTPYDAAVASQLQDYIEQKSIFDKNIQNATSVLSTADSALGNATNLVMQAKETGLGEIGVTSTAETKRSAATIIDEILGEMVSLGNTRFADRYIFAGRNTLTAPFSSTNGGIYFGGDTGAVNVAIDYTSSSSTSVDAAGAFGAVSAEVKGTRDLNPALSAQTLLSELNNGAGVAKGSITISDGLNTTTVDLSGAATVGDMLAAINRAVVPTTNISMNGGQFMVTTSRPGGSVTVTDTFGGTTANDLGIYSPTGAGHTLAGADVNPRLTAFTPLSTLGGVDWASGIVITNGGVTKTISFAGATSIQDVLSRINMAGLNIEAKINDAGNGIDVVSRLSGTDFSIGERGGTTAADLGIRSMTASTTLKSLNGGRGVSTGEGDDATFTLSDGTSFGVDLSGATTIGDVISAINTAAGNPGTLVASLATNGNGMVLTDSSGGAGTLSVGRANGSQAADDLGIMTDASGNTIYGKDVNPIMPDGVFSDLLGLRDALLNNNDQAISYYTDKLDGDNARILESRASVGAKQQRIDTVKDRNASELLELKSLLSDRMDLDYASSTVRFSTLQASFSAGLQTAASILQMSLISFLK